MARWTGDWLSGPGARLREDGDFRGARLGLAEHGAGSVASTGVRGVAFVVDLFAGFLIGGLFSPLVHASSPLARNTVSTTAVAVEMLVLTALTGSSLGMRLLGLRVLPLQARYRPPGLLAAAVRTALLLLVIPAVVTDRDGRGLHDRAARTVVVQAR